MPQPTLDAQLSSRTSSSSWHLWRPAKPARVGLLPRLDPEEPELRSQQGPCARLPPQGVQTDLGKPLLVLESPVLVEILSFIWRWSRLPAPSQEERCWWGRRRKIRVVPAHGLDPEWGSVERGGEIPTQSKDPGLGAGWKEPGELPTRWKGARQRDSTGEKLSNTWGLAEGCHGRSAGGD